MPDYDVVVLGGGSAGTAAAAAAAQAGACTAMVNEGELGGLCILRGCMPTKALLASAHAIHEANHLDAFGAKLEGRVVPDFAAIVRRKNEQVARFKRAKISGIERGSYEVLQGHARFAAGGGVELDGRPLTARSYVIATGSVPTHLPIPGLDDVPVWTSDEIMSLTEQPRSLIVQGAGPIGLELAQFFARVGTEVVLVNRSPLLSRCDPESGAELTRALEREPRLRLLVPGTIRQLTRDGDGLVARIESGDTVHEHRADALLMAAGRHARLDELQLEHVGLVPDGGLLEHDDTMQTTHPDIFVAGDATGTHQILHLATQEGRVAGQNAAGRQPRLTSDYRLKMQVIFTDPPYASVGATPDELRSEGHDVIEGTVRFPETGRAITMGNEHGLWKLFADRRSREILGSTCLGPRADDLIHLIALIMRYRGTIDEILDQPWYHPTLSEVILNAARDLRGQCS